MGDALVIGLVFGLISFLVFIIIAVFMYKKSTATSPAKLIEPEPEPAQVVQSTPGVIFNPATQSYYDPQASASVPTPAPKKWV